MNELTNLEKRLARTVVKKQAVIWLAGLAVMLTVLAALALGLSLLATAFIMPVPVKVTLLGGCIIGLGYAFYRYALVPARNERGIIKAALQLEEKHPELKGRLVAALQFRDLNIGKTNFSQPLVDLTILQALDLTKGVDFNEIVSGSALYKRLRPAVVMTAIAALIGLMAPGLFSTAFDVYSQPLTRVAPPPGYTLTVTPGNAERVKYSDVEIGGALIGTGFPDQVEVFYRFAEGRWQSEKMRVNHKTRLTAAAADTSAFVVSLKQVRRSFDYYVAAGDLRSETYTVDVVDRPRVTRLKVTVNYPAYTRLQPLTLDENTGSFAALMGSRADLEMETNRDIVRAELIASDSNQIPVPFEGSRGRVGFGITKDFTYHVHLLDGRGEENPDPIEYTITAVPDEYPIINVVFPGFDANLNEDMLIPFKLHIADDYGFSSLILKYQIISGGQKGDENVAVISFPKTISTEGEVGFNWDLENFNLMPADYVLYHFELADNDNISGPKVTKTRIYAARLPSIDEIVSESETEQEGRIVESEKILKEQRDMAQKLNQLAQELKTNQNLNWQNKKELENIIDQQQKTAQRLEEISKEMDNSLQKMQQNNLMSEQILQKLAELQKLFNEVATPEMKEALRKLQEALKEMSEEEIKKAMTQFQLTQEEMLKRLERTVELLKRLQIQQKMTAMLKMGEETLLEQNRVNVETQEGDAQKAARQAQREQQLQKQMAALKQEDGKLAEMIKESEFKDSPPHQQFIETVQNNQAPADMQQMESSLSQNRKESALNHGQEASQKLGSMVNEMRRILNDLADQEGQKLAAKIRETINDANYLSQEQEDLSNRTGDQNVRPVSLNEAAAEQQILREAAAGLRQRIDALGQQSPFLAADLYMNLTETLRQMESACNNLGQSRTRAAFNQQKDAIYNLNQTTVKLLDALEQQKQCNKGGSCNKNSQKLQSLCDKQNSINEQTTGSCPNPGQNMSASQREGLQRLAAEQGSVRKSLAELQQEFGDRREILGRLDGLSDEMKKIEEMLDQGQAGQELSNRQLRVYSRMLDLQKSLSRRDYTEQRKATTGEDILRSSPGPLEDDNSRLTESLQDRLQKSLQEGYPRQYEQQIKAYFKALSDFGQPRDSSR
ncbi:MAG: hypothetical protein PHR28_11925 [candidate division Zixibacteria bacterium]|nr:hypothetical protein [candidate division Zixibacteria bacterium]